MKINNYLIVEKLNESSKSIVYKAREEDTENMVVIKMLTKEYLTSEEIFEKMQIMLEEKKSKSQQVKYKTNNSI